MSLGLRILDPTVNLMSFFKLSATQGLSENFSGKTKINQVESDLFNTQINPGILKATLGVGFIF